MRGVGPILVVGSVHIDTIVDIAPGNADQNDSEGTLIRSIGGRGFNIATNLKLSNKNNKVRLYTFLAKGSLLTSIIKGKIRDRGIGQQFIKTRRKLYNYPITEGGYIALRNRETGYTIRAATQAPIGQEDFLLNASEANKLRSAIRGSQLVVLDTNLNQDSLRKAIQATTLCQRPTFVSVTSDHKARGYYNCVSEFQGTQSACFALAVSSLELSIILKRDLNEIQLAPFIDAVEGEKQLPAIPTPAQICTIARADHVICVAINKLTGAGAFFIFSAATIDAPKGNMAKFVPPSHAYDGTALGTRTGITDAVTSACVEFVALERKKSRDVTVAPGVLTKPENRAGLQDLINDYVGRVVSVKPAVPYAETDYDTETIDLARPWWAKYYDRTIGKLVEDWVTIILTVGVTLIATQWSALFRVASQTVICLLDTQCMKAQWIAALDYLKGIF